MPNVLGLQFGHDGAACVVKENRLVCSISNERLSRQKKAAGVTPEMIAYVLESSGLSLDDIDCVAVCSYFYSPENFVKLFDGQKREITQHVLDLPSGATHSPCIVQIGGKAFRGAVVQHHIAHSASVFYTAPVEKAACLSVDASMHRPEACSIFAYGEGRHLRSLYCPGLMIGNAYSVFTEKLGLGPGLTKAGTTMALASFGKPSKTAKKEWKRFAQSYYERPFQANDMAFINMMWSELSGRPPHVQLPSEDKDKKEAMNIAASIQHIFEESLIDAANTLFKKTKSFNDGNLCIVGGSFLNSNANMAIKQKSSFDNVFVFPACGDDGTAAGAALFVTHELLEQERESYQPGDIAYLGREYPDPDDGEPYDAAAVAKAISEGKIVACCRGRSEFGPRALGNRSILADPRSSEMKDTINERVKHREWFRPFAPAILAEKVEDWFDISFLSPYMLFIAECKQADKIPAVMHVDNTGRLQTVAEEDNPAFHELISEFEKITGVPILLNTSLNDNGEPLVESPDDARKFFAKGNVDMLILGNKVFHLDSSK